MTDKQPEALRLADALLETVPKINDWNEAAAELRRLHEVNAELVEAAKLSLIAFKGHWNMDKTHRDRTAMDATIAALAKAEGK
jgi:peptide subunit release factor RF-3